MISQGTHHFLVLFYIVDSDTGTQFLVDIGSEVSAIPHSLSNRKGSPDKLNINGS